MRYLLPRRVTMDRSQADLDKIFDESHLYKNSSEVWRSYQHYLKHGPFTPRKKKYDDRRPNTNYSKSRST
jgi:hypothetical protein